MSNLLLIHATGLCALVLNTVALACTSERSLRLRTGLAGVAWALNNFLMGADVAAALNVVSAGRTATAAATLDASRRLRRTAFGGFVVLTLLVGAATWNGTASLLMIAASLMSTYAMFHLTGSALRWVMLAVSALWMVNACSVGSWEQIAANVLSAAAALWGVRRVARQKVN